MYRNLWLSSLKLVLTEHAQQKGDQILRLGGLVRQHHPQDTQAGDAQPSRHVAVHADAHRHRIGIQTSFVFLLVIAANEV
jgi:hypothetical protein